MRPATIRTTKGFRAVRLDDDVAVDLGAADLVEVLRRHGWHRRALDADGITYELDDLDYAPVVLAPEKVLCVGLNYRPHIEEMGRELPTHPTLFAKYSCALVGAYDDIVLPDVGEAMDWEAELAVVVGDVVRRADVATARDAIAFTARTHRLSNAGACACACSRAGRGLSTAISLANQRGDRVGLCHGEQ